MSLLTTLLGHHIDIYRDHFEFFLKALGLYLTLTGGLGWATFGANVGPLWKAGAAIISCATAVLALYGSFFSMRWVRSIEGDVGEICAALNLKPIAFRGAKDTIRMAIVFKVLILAASLVCAVVFIRQ